MLTGTALDPLSCRACSGSGLSVLHGPSDRPCHACAATGIATCRDCRNEATEIDSNAHELGGACLDCATRCACGSVATVLAETTDDQGDATREIDLCADCHEIELERIERIRRYARARDWAGLAAGGEAA